MTSLFSPLLVILLGLPLMQDSVDSDRPRLSRYEAIEFHMGVKFIVVLYAESDEQARDAFGQAFGEISRLNDMLSDYDPESELSALGAGSPHSEPVEISSEFKAVLTAGLEISSQSGGAFDPTVGPLTKLWRRSRRSGELPVDDELRQALAATGFEAIKWSCDGTRVKLARPNMRLDLGGIAKGYAADRALLVLARLGIKSAFIDASGDITLGDPPPGRDGWGVGVAPLDATRQPSLVLSLANCGVATSGDAWQAVEIDGKRYSHIVNPHTGVGLTQRSSVTVIAPNGTLADAWASAVSVLGPQEGIELIDQIEEVQTLVVYVEGDQTRVARSSNFPEQ